MASVVPVLTDGVIVLNAYTNDDIPAHLAGEDEENRPPFRLAAAEIDRGRRPGCLQLLGTPLGNRWPDAEGVHGSAIQAAPRRSVTKPPACHDQPGTINEA